MNTSFALVTVTTPSFVVGTAVLLHSFLERNKWFAGDFIIIHDDLDCSCEKYFRTIPNLKFVPVSTSLKMEIRAVTAGNAHLERFYSLQAFLLDGYTKVAFCDSDLLFCDSIENVFYDPHPFICCGDGAYYKKMFRKRHSFEATSDSSESDVLRNTFNAGFMVVDQQFLGEFHYHNMMEILRTISWGEKTTGHTDQRIYNLYFSGKQKLLSSCYNYLLRHYQWIQKKEKHNVAQAKVIHFSNIKKPWQQDFTYWLMNNSHDNSMVRGYELWYDAYFKYIRKMHMHNLFSGR